ncbi:MAG: metal ABC transporter permease [Thermoleophilaceae bacterium]|nr:metal ABC transporter permease [Thermoleophilaceae bacterium]
MIAATVLAPLGGDFGLLSALELVIVGGACGAVGVWVLHFGRAILAESFTHALLPGLVLAAIVGAGLLLGAVVGVIAAYGLLLLAARAPKTSSGTATSVSVTLLVALGALLASSGNGIASFESLLFGNPLAASSGDVLIASALAVGIAVALTALGGQFAALAFDARSAPTLGVNAGMVSAAALALLAVSVSVAANVAGSLLALALVTGPAFGASAVTHRLRSSLALATAAGSLSGVVGLYLSYYADWPASASIALVICLWAAGAAAVAGLQARTPRLG